MDSLRERALKLIDEKKLPVYELAFFSEKETASYSFKDEESVHPIYSLSKNFVSAGFGAYLNHESLNLNESVYSLFSGRYPSMSEQWKEVSIANVLTQTTGIDRGYLDIDQDSMDQYGNDYLKAILNFPLVHKADTHFQYSDSNYYLASKILEVVEHRSYNDILMNDILKPLSIHLEKRPLCDPQGNCMGATGLFLHALDVAKLGYTFLNGGVYRGQRLLDANYCQTALKPLVKVNETTSYGYSFWSQPQIGAHYGNGMFGQFLYLSSSKMAVAYLSDNRLGSVSSLEELFYDDASTGFRKPINTKGGNH